MHITVPSSKGGHGPGALCSRIFLAGEDTMAPGGPPTDRPYVTGGTYEDPGHRISRAKSLGRGA
jgi:hypothetical protein